MIDLQNFRKKVANALFTQKSRANITGHAWLVETEAGNRKRTGKATAGATASGTKWKIYEHELAVKPPSIGTKRLST